MSKSLHNYSGGIFFEKKVDLLRGIFACGILLERKGMKNMVTVKDIIPMLMNPDKSSSKKVRIQMGKEIKDYLIKKDLMLTAFDDYVVNQISFNWEEQIWLINIEIEPWKS